MQENLAKLTVPAIWLGLIALLLGIIAHFANRPVVTLTADAYLEVTQTCFLYAIAAALLKKS